jgi:hypothetical protein
VRGMKFYRGAQCHLQAKLFPAWNYFLLAMAGLMRKYCDHRSLIVFIGRKMSNLVGWKNPIDESSS